MLKIADSGFIDWKFMKMRMHFHVMMVHHIP